MPSFVFAIPRVVAAFAALATAGAIAQPAASPASPANLELTSFHIRDPWILPYAPTRTYYLFATNNADVTGVHRAGVMAYKSTDLKHWSAPSLVFTLPDGTWADPREGAWAPEVHAYKGRYYLFVTLHNPARIIAQPPQAWRTTFARGTTIAVADSPDGPFTLLRMDRPTPPPDFMTLDGTLYVDPAGKPWMVYAHEWAQKIDGTMEAVPLSADLSAATDAPIFLFKASDAPWLDSSLHADARENSYVTDGPELFRSKDGHLLMLWASFGAHGYVETVARSRSGNVQGPWEQLPPLFEGDGGHGMLFRTFDGRLMLVLHCTNTDPHAKLFDVEDLGDRLALRGERKDLDGAQ
jgi:hypothetical protein